MQSQSFVQFTSIAFGTLACFIGLFLVQYYFPFVEICQYSLCAAVVSYYAPSGLFLTAVGFFILIHTMRSAKLLSMRSAATIAILAVGLALIVLGVNGSFTSVTCSRFVPTVVSGTAILKVGECTGFLGYDYVAGVAGIAIVSVSGFKIVRLLNMIMKRNKLSILAAK